MLYMGWCVRGCVLPVSSVLCSLPEERSDSLIMIHAPLHVDCSQCVIQMYGCMYMNEYVSNLRTYIDELL